MTRDQALAEASHAAAKAKRLAEHAESASHSNTRLSDVAIYAPAGALWADVSRAYTALAATLPNTTPEA